MGESKPCQHGWVHFSCPGISWLVQQAPPAPATQWEVAQAHSRKGGALFGRWLQPAAARARSV